MTLQVSASSIIWIFMLSSCRFTPQKEKIVINQIYTTGEIKAFVVHEISGNNRLIIKRNGKEFHTENMGQEPCEIRSITNDTIYIERYILVQNDIIKSQHKERDTKLVNNEFIVLYSNVFLNGTSNLGVKKVDSIKRKGTELFFYINNHVDTLI